MLEFEIARGKLYSLRISKTKINEHQISRFTAKETARSKHAANLKSCKTTYKQIP